MVTRAQLTVSYFNTGIGLAQSRNKQGRFKHQILKVTRSWAIKKCIGQKTTTYKNYIMDKMNYLKKDIFEVEKISFRNVPDYIGGVEKPKKALTILNV